MAKLTPEERDRLTNLATRLSFWLGGVCQVLIKGIAFFFAGSTLLRTSLIESMGDIASNAILAVTQTRVRDPTDNHLYPTGKQRLTPLGILFFAAFGVSTMTGLIISSLQSLFEPVHESETRGALLKKLFDEQPQLRQGLRPTEVDNIIAAYSAREEFEETSSQMIMLVLLGVCIVIKGGLFAFCICVAKRADSEIAKTLAIDHRNDVVANSTVVLLVLWTYLAKLHGRSGLWLDKLDPAASLALSCWILYCWMLTALEQIHVLSHRRAEDATVEAVIAVATKFLEDSPFILDQSETYHIGEGYAVRLTLYPRDNTKQVPTEIASVLEALEAVVLGSELEVREVHARLRNGRTSPQQASSESDFSWVGQYTAPAR